MHKIDLTAIKAEDITDTPKIVTPMPEPVVIPAKLKTAMGGEPDAMWIYRMADGAAFGAVARWNPEGARKEIRPIVWDGKKFITSGFGQRRPLYNGELLAAVPSAPVLIVEGEKAADGAAQYIPDGWVVVTWQGGSKAVEQTDWSVLDGHPCVIWPDNDLPGAEAALEIQNILNDRGVATSIVALSPSWPQGWDLGDELPAKVTAKHVNEIVKRELKRVAVPDKDAPDEIIEEEVDYDEAREREYRALGYDNNRYCIMTQKRQQPDWFEPGNLMSKKGCINIYPDATYWGAQQGKPDGNGVDWIDAGAKIMERCEAIGVYDPKRERGRGIWLDKAEDGVDRAVLNTGGKLIVNRPGDPTREIDFVRFKSRWVYGKSYDLILDAHDYTRQSSDDEGRMIRELCNKVRWLAPIYGDLLAGWIATAVVCGGLQWRTHAWVTGNQGSGKSTIVSEIAGACLGDTAIWPLGATTEAGIRQTVGNDAVPVVFDESETDDDKKAMAAAQRRKAVIDLMRQASSEGRGRILKGSANHSAQSFTMRSAFLMSSIGVGLKEAADLTRTAVLTIKPPESFTREDKAKKDQEFKDFLSLASEIPPEMPQRLLARQLQNLFTLRHNIEVFKEQIALALANRRIGDQLGTLIAGCYSLYSTRRLDAKQAEKYLNTVNLEEFLQVKSEREDLALLQHIVGSPIRVETAYGVQERQIGELMLVCMTRDDTGEIRLKNAEATLARNGLKLAMEGGTVTGFWIGKSVQGMSKIMSTSAYYEGWDGVLLRHPYASNSTDPIRFGGMTSRAIFMPKHEWPVGL